MKPTLGNLEKMFAKNEPLKAPFKKRLQTTISWVLNKGSVSLEAFEKELGKENVSVVLRRGKDDVIYGITYIDHRSKTVFNGSDIGVSFSAKAILEKCRPSTALKPSQTSDSLVKEMPMLPTNANSKLSEKQPTQFELKLPEVNLSETPAGESIPYQLKKRRRRKKKRISI